MRTIVNRTQSFCALAGILLVAGCGSNQGTGLLFLSISADPQVPDEAASKLVISYPGGKNHTYAQAPFPPKDRSKLPLKLQVPNLPAGDTPTVFTVQGFDTSRCAVTKPATTSAVVIKAGAATELVAVTLVKSDTNCADGGDAAGAADGGGATLDGAGSGIDGTATVIDGNTSGVDATGSTGAEAGGVLLDSATPDASTLDSTKDTPQTIFPEAGTVLDSADAINPARPEAADAPLGSETGADVPIGSGGTPGSGGISGLGGGPGTGGATAGGATGTGGIVAGGATGMGGAAASDASATGGTTEAGGTTGTGGTTGAGGATGTPPNLIASTSSLPLGQVLTSELSIVGSFTITNIGQQLGGPLALSSTNSAFVIQTGAAADCVTGTTALAQNASCTVRVVFLPTVVGDQSALVTYSVPSGSSGAVSVSGSGLPGSALSSGSTFSLTFGSFLVGASSPAQNFTITNIGPGPSGTIAVTSNNGEFIVQSGGAGDCASGTLAPGGSCTVRIVFTPGAAGGRSATIAFSASPGGSASVFLSGTGAACATGSHNGGDGITCVSLYTCASGYHNDGTGNCVATVPGYCQTDYLTDGTGTCVPIAGVTWTQRLRGTWLSVASSADGTKLVAVDTGPVNGGGYIYTSTDSGATWHAQASWQQWLSVASSADGTKLVASSQPYIYTSTDSGTTWTQQTPLPLDSIASSADGTKLVAARSGGGYICTSTDSGATWNSQPSEVISSVASSADGTKLVAVCEFDGATSTGTGYIHTSTDSGATWTQRDSPHAWTAVASSAVGTKLVAVASDGVGTSRPGGYIYTSADSGATWNAQGSPRLYWTLVSSSADGTKLVAAVALGYIYTSTDAGVTWYQRASSRPWRSLASSADGTKLVAVDSYAGNVGDSTGFIWTSSGPVP